MLLSRTIPVAGITVLFSLVANVSTTGLVLFAYTLAMFTILTALTSMCLGATGNILIFCNGLLSLAMAHLRGMNDTLKPQLLVNIVFFTALTPLLYSITPEPLTLPWYINLQAIALLCIWVILTFRIFLLHHRSRSTLCSVQ